MGWVRSRLLAQAKHGTPLTALLRGWISEQKRLLSASQRRAGVGEVLVSVCAPRSPSLLLPYMINHP